jgi:carbon starvation protein CstA
MSVSPHTWKLMISGYVLISAGLPVWLFLQSRDFINVHILYVGMVFLVVAVVSAALRGGGQVDGGAAIPFNNWGEASRALGPGWPVLFVVIACGAVSGFHGLCAGGTTCKQLNNEPAARRVGYYGMLLESFLAVCVVCCLILGLSLVEYKGYCYPEDAKRNAVLAFAMAVGHTAHAGLGLPIAAGARGAMLLLEGFLVTTLDTAIRLTRYLIEEGWATLFGHYDVFADAAAAQARSISGAGGPELGTKTAMTGTGGLTTGRPGGLEPPPRTTVEPTDGLFRQFLMFLKHYWVNSGIAVGLMLTLGLGNGYLVLWKIFGSANQLLAALTLLVASCWLFTHRRPVWYTLLPAVFMLITSGWMLLRLTAQDLPNWTARAPLVIAELVVIVMATGIVILTIARWHNTRRAQQVAVAVEP